MTASRESRVVCLCASPAQADALAEATRTETVAGRIVLGPGCDMSRPHPLWNDPADQATLATRLSVLQRRKIDLADEVVIITLPSGAVDEEATGELAYARRRGKPVRFWSPPHLLDITRRGMWQLCCTGRRADLARPCAPAIPCGCTLSEVRKPVTGSVCPYSPDGEHFLADGTPSYAGPGCSLAAHHDLAAALRDDIAEPYGPGTYLIDYELLYNDQIALTVNATLAEPPTPDTQECERCGMEIAHGLTVALPDTWPCPSCANNATLTHNGAGEVPK